MKLIALLALATTLSAQQKTKQKVFEMPSGDWSNIQVTGNSRNAVILGGAGYLYDGNGALEAFYTRPAHRSIFRSKRFWVALGAVAGSAALTGYWASRSSSYRPGAPLVPQQPGQLAPTVDSVTRIGIGGPGIPVTVVQGGFN